MRGWVYVMSNRSMPNLVKVGFSTKDPDLRAKELDHTGTPHPYVVDYEALVHHPYKVEQKAHKLLAQFNEGKEWFRCSAEDAIYAIKQATVGEVLQESFRKVDRQAVEARVATEKKRLHEAQIEKERLDRARAKVEQSVEQVRQRYQTQLDSLIVDRPFFLYWIAGAAIVMVAIGVFNPHMKDGPALFLTASIGAAIAAYIKSGSADRQKKKPGYVDLVKKMELDIKAVLSPIVQCPNCSKRWQLDAHTVAARKPNTQWKCTECKTILPIPENLL